jgi:hypothetical protein
MPNGAFENQLETIYLRRDKSKKVTTRTRTPEKVDSR